MWHVPSEELSEHDIYDSMLYRIDNVNSSEACDSQGQYIRHGERLAGDPIPREPQWPQQVSLTTATTLFISFLGPFNEKPSARVFKQAFLPCCSDFATPVQLWPSSKALPDSSNWRCWANHTCWIAVPAFTLTLTNLFLSSTWCQCYPLRHVCDLVALSEEAREMFATNRRRFA